MTIYVYEQDLLIREDVVETLKSAFDKAVRPVTTVQDVAAAGPDAVSALVLSVSRAQAEEMLMSDMGGIPKEKVVLIAGSLPDGLTRSVAAYVAKPFSGDAVVGAVKTVLCAPQ